MFQLIQCLKSLLEQISLCKFKTAHLGSVPVLTCPPGGAVYSAPILLRGFDGTMNSYHSRRWQRGMVLGCSRVQKVEQLNAALSLLLWLLHIQHDPLLFPPNPTAAHRLVFSGGGCGISGWGEGNILFSLSWLVYLYREKVNLAQVMKEKSL